jgi:hypothetical protein
VLRAPETLLVKANLAGRNTYMVRHDGVQVLLDASDASAHGGFFRCRAPLDLPVSLGDFSDLMSLLVHVHHDLICSLHLSDRLGDCLLAYSQGFLLARGSGVDSCQQGVTKGNCEVSAKSSRPSVPLDGIQGRDSEQH